MKTVPIGAKGRFQLVVRPEHLASEMKDSTLPQVLATPIMILAMENAALNAIRGHLEPGETALGIMVEIRHLSATPAGAHVTARAELVEAKGRRLTFAVSAQDETEEIGRGTHARMVIDRRDFEKRVNDKRARKS